MTEETQKRTALIVRGFVSAIVFDRTGYDDPIFEFVESEDAQIGQRWDGEAFSDPVIIRQAIVRDGVVINVCLAPEGFDAGDGTDHVASDTAQTGDAYEDGEFISPVIEAPLPPAPTTVLIASGIFQVSDGEVLSNGQPAGIGFAMQMDTGQFWLFFDEEQPDTSYAVYAGSSQGLVNYTGRATDHFVLTVTDGGAPINPTEFSINVTVTRAT